MEELKLPKEINSSLLKALSESKDASLILTGYLAGKELSGRIGLNAEFYLTVEEIKQSI